MGNTDSKNARKVRRAIRQNDAATLQKLVKQKVDLDLAINHYSRNTPLILASCYASGDVIPTLLKVCKDKDAYNAEGHTALDKAIMFYSLANEYHPHKTKELLKRRRVVQLLVDGGVTRVRSAELELWIRVNKSDPVFIHTITHLMCRSNNTSLKSVGLAVMLRINADLTCAACFLEAGATYRNYKLMYLSDLPAIDYKMPVNLAVLILQSTSDSLILQHIENIFLSAYPATRMKDEAREEILQLLLQNDHSIRYSHQKQYPEYDGLIEYHKHSLKSLKWLSRRVIRQNSYPNVFFAVHQLDLPKKLENYVLLNEDADAEDPTLNASKNLNMGSNPPSAQVVRRRPRPPSAISTAENVRSRARPFSHFHPADEIEKRRHRYSHSSVPSSPICPTTSLEVTSDFSPVKRRLRKQNSPYKPRPRSQAVARRDMPIVELSPLLVKRDNNGTQNKTSGQDKSDGDSYQGKEKQKENQKRTEKKTQVSQQEQQNIIESQTKSVKEVQNENQVNSSSGMQNKENVQVLPKKSPMIPVRRMPPGQAVVRPVVLRPVESTIQEVDRKPVSTQETTQSIMQQSYSDKQPTYQQPYQPAYPDKQPVYPDKQPGYSDRQPAYPDRQLEQKIVIKVPHQVKTSGPQRTPKITLEKPMKGEVIKMSPQPTRIPAPSPKVKQNKTKDEFQNIAVPRPQANTKVVSSINQPVLSTFAPDVRPAMSPRRSPRDAKRSRPHSHFIPASEVRNIFPPPNMSPQVRDNQIRSQPATMTRSFPAEAGGLGQQRMHNQMMSQSMSLSYHAPGKLSDHVEYDTEFATHLEEALKKRQSQASPMSESEEAEFVSHLEEALMKRRSQPPGHYVPTKEVLLDFGTPSDSPHASRSAGSTLNRQEVLLRPGSASLPRTDSNRRRSRNSPPSSPFNLKVNPRFIVAGSSSSNTNLVRPNPPTVEAIKGKQNSDSDYDEIDDASSNSSGTDSSVNENEGYTRF